MFHYLTPAELEKKNKKILAYGHELKEKGYTPELIASRIWNKYGYPAEVKNGIVQVWAGHVIIGTI